MNKLLKPLILATITVNLLAGQNLSHPKGWHLNNGNTGINEGNYEELLKDMPSDEIIVAVIDSGVDYTHEDLDGSIWTNEDEIPNNLIDDDNNGYVDDIHGWNFIGFSNGENVKYGTLIQTRIYSAGKKYPGNDETYQKAKRAYLIEKRDALKQRDNFKKILTDIDRVTLLLKKTIATKDEIEKLIDKDLDLKPTISKIINKENTYDLIAVRKQIKNKYEYYQKAIDYYYNPIYNSRHIVGDHVENNDYRSYGNNDVVGPNANHGTHVAGIIAAERNNNIGINGIANNVKIMIIRAVPDGDERDKDVANSIRYAVDNGAKIINMSFGKAFSWNKKIVDDAVRYAQRKDVLIVHAAGNSSLELTGENNFPNNTFVKKPIFGKKHPNNWIEVGATTNFYDKYLTASFSNYSHSLVDLFAPGYQIYSTSSNNSYRKLSGTSMAAPMVTGVAAILRSYFPMKTAQEVRDIIMNSATSTDLMVRLPGGSDLEKDLIPFTTLSRAGAILNCKHAIELALEKQISN